MWRNVDRNILLLFLSDVPLSLLSCISPVYRHIQLSQWHIRCYDIRRSIYNMICAKIYLLFSPLDIAIRILIRVSRFFIMIVLRLVNFVKSHYKYLRTCISKMHIIVAQFWLKGLQGTFLNKCSVYGTAKENTHVSFSNSTVILNKTMHYRKWNQNQKCNFRIKSYGSKEICSYLIHRIILL